MMIGAQISIQIISAEGPPLIIALKDVRNFEMQAEEPVFYLLEMTCAHPHHHLCTLFPGRIHRNIC